MIGIRIALLLARAARGYLFGFQRNDFCVIANVEQVCWSSDTEGSGTELAIHRPIEQVSLLLKHRFDARRFASLAKALPWCCLPNTIPLFPSTMPYVWMTAGQVQNR
jgi:hypothetical protein